MLKNFLSTTACLVFLTTLQAQIPDDDQYFHKHCVDGFCGLVALEGEVIIPLLYSDVVSLKHPEPTSEEVAPMLYRYTYAEAEGVYYKVRHHEDTTHWGLWKLPEGILMEPVYDDVAVLRIKGPYAAKKNGLWALFTEGGWLKSEHAYTWLRMDPERPKLVFAGLPDSSTTVLSLETGKPVDTLTYDAMIRFGNIDTGPFITEKDGLLAVHRVDGTRITKHKYNYIMYCFRAVPIAGLAPKGRRIVACALLEKGDDLIQVAIDDVGTEYPYDLK